MIEKSFVESEKVFRELFDNISSGVAVYESINNGKDFLVKDINKAGEEINNVNKKEIIDKKITDIFPGIKELGLINVLQRVWKTGKSEHHPLSLYKDKKITNWVENYVYKLPSGLIVAIFDDVSEQEKAENNLKDSEDTRRSSAQSKVRGCIRRGNLPEERAEVSQWKLTQINSTGGKRAYVRRSHASASLAEDRPFP